MNLLVRFSPSILHPNKDNNATSEKQWIHTWCEIERNILTDNETEYFNQTNRPHLGMADVLLGEHLVISGPQIQSRISNLHFTLRS